MKTYTAGCREGLVEWCCIVSDGRGILLSLLSNSDLLNSGSNSWLLDCLVLRRMLFGVKL